MALLDLKNVDISYGKRLIVKDCNLSLKKGEICAIVGESGSGKTTVIRAVLGLLAGGGKVTKGDMLNGVRFTDKYAVTHTVVMRGVTGTVRFIEAYHDYDRKPDYVKIK